MSEWRDIETAPKDGNYFLVACPPDEEVDRWSFGVAFWSAGSPYVKFVPVEGPEPEIWKRVITNNPRIEVSGGWSKPTHWMPLPDPPAPDALRPAEVSAEDESGFQGPRR